MKKATLALLFSLTISIVNYGQVELKTGQPYKVVKATDKWYFQNTKNIIAIKFSRKKITLQTIDKVSLTETAMNIIDELPKGYVFEFIVELDNRLYMLSSIRDKKNDVEQLFSQEINIDNATFKGDPKLILSVEGRIFFGDYYSSQYVHKFNFQTSFDKSKLLITYRRKPEEKKDAKSYDIIGLNVFEKDMKNFSSQEITMPYTEKKMDNLDYTVDSEGNTYSLAKVYNDNTTDDKKRSKDTESNYHMELFKIKYKTNKIQVIQIELAGKFIKDLWIVETAQKDIMCAGYYNNGATSGLNLGFRSLKVGSSGVDGVVLLKVSNDGIVSNMSSHEIPLEIMNQYVSLRRQKKNAKKDDKDKLELTDLKFKNLQINPDGSTVLIGEKEYVVAHTHTDSKGRTTTTYSYHYDEIIVTKITKEGKLAWMTKIPKAQVGRRGQGSMSYSYLKDASSHNFIYMDNDKNKVLDLDQYPAMYSDNSSGFMICQKINDLTGKLERISLFDTKDADGLKVKDFFTARVLLLNQNEFGFELYKGKKEDVFFKVKIK